MRDETDETTDTGLNPPRFSIEERLTRVEDRLDRVEQQLFFILDYVQEVAKHLGVKVSNHHKMS